MSILCSLLKHKWEKRFSEIPESAMFFRVDCERCGEAIDGAALRRLGEHAAKLIGMKP